MLTDARAISTPVTVEQTEVSDGIDRALQPAA